MVAVAFWEMLREYDADLANRFRHALAWPAIMQIAGERDHGIAPNFGGNLRGYCLVGDNFGAMFFHG